MIERSIPDTTPRSTPADISLADVYGRAGRQTAPIIRPHGSRATRPLTILTVMDSRHVSGPAKQLLAAAAAAAAEDVVYRLALFQRGASDTALGRAAREQGLEPLWIASHHPGDLAAVPALLRAARTPGVDIVQTHGYKPNVLMAIVRRFAAPAWISFLHGETAENRRVKLYFRAERLAVRFADRAVIVSESQRRLYRGVSPAKLRVVNNAVLAPLDDAAPPTQEPVVGVVGRLSPEKGVDIALRALARMRHDARLVIVGDGPERTHLVRLAADLGVSDRVVWEGWVANTDRVYRRLSVVVIPSRSEGMPNVALEAMAAGVPVVATRVGGLPEIIDDGRTGLLVPPANPEALAAAVGRVRSDSGERRRLAASARRAVGERFSIRRRLQQLRTLYDDVIAR